jgi:hypothetical protein
MGLVEGHRPHTFFTPDGTGSASHGNQQEPLPAPFQALTEQHHASPEIIELVSVLYDTYTVQRQLEAAAQRPQDHLHDAPPVFSALERYGSVLHIDPPVHERLRRASLFVEAAVHIMRGSFTAYPDDPPYLQATLNAAYAPYGFQVAEGQGEITDLTNRKSSKWHKRLEQQIDRYAVSRKVHRIPYERLHFQICNDRLWEPVGQFDEEPEVLFLIEHMNHVRRVQLRLWELKQENWFRSSRREENKEHVAGLHPYYRERYSQAGDILEHTAGGVIEDGHADDSFNWLHALAYRFNEALYDLNMHIDVNPTWTPEQLAPPLIEDTLGRITKIEEVE